VLASGGNMDNGSCLVKMEKLVGENVGAAPC